MNTDVETELKLLRAEVARLRIELTRFTDDNCYGRCDSPDGLRDWFIWETRGTLTPREAHEVLDMLLNKLRADGYDTGFSQMVNDEGGVA